MAQEKLRVLVTDGLSPKGVEILRNCPRIDVQVVEKADPKELPQVLCDFDGLVVRSATKVTREALAKTRRLKVIGRAGVGVDNIDVAAATERGVIVMNTPLGNINSAAEHALALLFATARDIAAADRSLRAGRWDRKSFVGVELSGKVLGIIGMGKIGQIVCNAALALSMEVIACDPYLAREKAEAMGAKLVEMDDLLARSDFITIHTPLSDKTRGMIGAGEIAKMKKTARLVNCARGGIVDEKALAEALAAGKIARAGVDVFAEEPTTASPLFELASATVTPHLGASTEEAQLRVAEDIALQMVEFFEKGVAKNAVNLAAALDPKLAPFARLAEKLGRIASQMSGPHAAAIEAVCRGEIAKGDVEAIAMYALQGMLRASTDELVNMVNAPLVAARRGIALKQSRSSDAGNYRNEIEVRVSAEDGLHCVAGTIFEDSNERLVRIGDLDVDLRPADHMLVMFYPDRPGMIGKFGTILGAHGINIAAMEVGRKAKRGQAVVVLTLDDEVPDAVVAELRQKAGVERASVIRL